MERCIHCKSPAKNSLLSLHMAYATRMRMHAPVLPLLIQHAPQHMKVLTTEPLALQMASISSKMMMWRPLFMPHCGHNTGTHHSQSQHLMLTLIACRFVLFAVLLFGGCCCCFFSLFFFLKVYFCCCCWLLWFFLLLLFFVFFCCFLGGRGYPHLVCFGVVVNVLF